MRRRKNDRIICEVADSGYEVEGFAGCGHPSTFVSKCYCLRQHYLLFSEVESSAPSEDGILEVPFYPMMLKQGASSDG